MESALVQLVAPGVRGIWRGFYRPFVPAGRGFYLGLAGPKVKVPAIPRAWGGGGMVTIDWRIMLQ